MSPRIDPDVGCIIPEPGQWPVDPQDDQPVEDSNIWADGCFDFFHHGHAGLLLQSRRLGHTLTIGVHSDADITANKGPTVMNLAERVAAANACRFGTKCVPNAPYVTSLPWISHYGCRFVAHGDDITSDAGGGDCYRFVKQAGRMKIVRRTEGISTTDLVGRMLGCTRQHFVASLTEVLAGREKMASGEGQESVGRKLREYAMGPDAVDGYVSVYSHSGLTTSAATDGRRGTFAQLVKGHLPRPGQRIVYTSGAFDLFSSGHIAFLRQITDLESDLGKQRSWYSDSARQRRLDTSGEDYPPAYVIVGIQNDEVVNERKGLNYPIMNIFERGLCVTQCRYVHSVIFEAPAAPSKELLLSLPQLPEDKQWPDVVYHGPTSTSYSSAPASLQVLYADARAIGIYVETAEHEFQDVNSAQIVKRILDKRVEYEERQRKKGVKSVGEGALRRKEMEEELENRQANCVAG